MKVAALLIALVVVSASALDTAEFTFANSKLQKLKDAVVVQVSSAQNALSTAVWVELSYLLEIKSQVMSEVTMLGSTQLVNDVTALINSITAKITAKFYPDTLAQSILAPYGAVFSAWYARLSSDIATLNSTNPPVKIACLKAVQGSINGNITDLTSRIGNKVNQQLTVIQSRFDALNIQINADLAGINNNIGDTCGSDFTCAAGVVESSLPAVSAKADVYISQAEAAFASDVKTAGVKAGELNDIFVKRYNLIGADFAKCA